MHHVRREFMCPQHPSDKSTHVEQRCRRRGRRLPRLVYTALRCRPARTCREDFDRLRLRVWGRPTAAAPDEVEDEGAERDGYYNATDTATDHWAHNAVAARA